MIFLVDKKAKQRRNKDNKAPRYDNDQIGENVYGEFEDENNEFDECIDEDS